MKIEKTPDSRSCVEHFLLHIGAKNVEVEAVLDALGYMNNRKSFWLSSAVSAAVALGFVCLNVFNNTSDNVRQYRIITLSMAVTLVVIAVFAFLMGLASHRHLNSPTKVRAYGYAKLFFAELKNYAKLFGQKGWPDHDFAFSSLVEQGKVVASIAPEWKCYSSERVERAIASGVAMETLGEMYDCSVQFFMLPTREQFTMRFSRSGHTAVEVVSVERESKATA